MKRAAILGLSAVLLLAGAVIVLPTFIDWNRYKDTFAGMLRDATGRDIEVGSLGFHLLPQPTIRASGVSIGNIEGGKSPFFAHVQAVDMRVAFLPLLTGRLQIDSVGLVQPEVDLEMLPGGGNNWTFGDGGGQGGTNVRIEQLSVDGGTLGFTDAAGKHYQATDISGTLHADSLDGPFKGSTELRYSDVPLRITLEAGNLATGAPAPLSITLGVMEANADVGFSGSVTPKTRDFSGMLTAKGPDLNDLADALAPLSDSTPAALPAAPFQMTGMLSGSDQAVSLKSLAVSLAGEGFSGALSAKLGGAPSIRLTLSATRFNLDKVMATMPAGAAPPSRDNNAQPASFSLPDNLSGSVDIGADAIDYRGGIMRQLRLKATLKGGALTIDRAAALLPGGSDIAVGGRLTSNQGQPVFAGDVSANSGNLRALLTWAGADVSAIPEGQLAQFNLNTPLLLTGKRLRLTGIDMGLDRTQFKGDMDARLGDVPDITAKLSMDRLDVDAYMPAKKAGGKSKTNLDWLDRFKTNLTLKAERLGYKSLIATDVATHVSLDRGLLTVDRFEADQFGGAKLSGKGTVTDLAHDAAADLSLHLQGESADRLLTALGYEDSFTHGALGKFALDATLKGNAASAAVTAKGAVGTSTFDVRSMLKNLDADMPQGSAEFDISNPDLRALADQMGRSLPAPAAGMPVALSGTLKGMADQGTVDASLKVATGSFDVSGNYASPSSGMSTLLQIKGEQADPVPLMRALGLTYKPAGPLGRSVIEAKLTAEPKKLRLEGLHLGVGDMQVDGSASIDSTGKRPMVTAQLQGTAINMDAFLPPATAGLKQAQAVNSRSAAAKAQVRWSHQPLDWAAIRDNDADIRVTAKAISYGPYRFSGPELRVTAKDGELKVEPLSAGLFGGTATIRATADAGNMPTLSVQTDFKDVDAAQLEAATMGSVFATGRVAMTGAFTARGNSQFEMIKGLSGQAHITARNGVIRKVDLKKMSAQLNGLKTMSDFLPTARVALSGGQTPYESLEGDVVVQKGVATTHNVMSKIEAAKADLQATMDLPNWRVDALGSFQLTEVPGAPPVTVSLNGPIDSPAKTLGTKQLQAFFVSKLGAAVLRQAIGSQESGLGQLLGEGSKNSDEATQSQTSPTQQTPQDNSPQDTSPLKPFQLLLDQLRKRQ